MKYLALAFTFISSALACEIHLPHQVLFLDVNQQDLSVIETKNCSEDAARKTYEVLAQLEGRVPSYQLKELISHKGINAEIYPQSVLINHLHNISKSQLNLPHNILMKNIVIGSNKAAMALSHGDQIQIICPTCQYEKNQNFSILVTGFDGNSTHYPGSADFKKMVKAYRLLSPIHSFSDIQDKKILKEELVEEAPHIEYLSDTELFKYYKTNKSLRAGELLKKADFNAVKIVKAGLKTEVVLENALVRIKTQGISRGNAAIGEIVEVYHPEKKKKFQGKVIDINKVLVEL